MSKVCTEHLDFTGSACPECKLAVNQYGNTEDSFEFCQFPDCGCDGARLCMAKNGASDDSNKMNVEGMWHSKDKKAKVAIGELVGFCAKRKTK